MSAAATGLAGYDVSVTDHGVDAMIVERPGLPPLLVLRPSMSFGAAVAAVTAVAPFAPEAQVRALVRKHLPAAFDLGLDAMADELAESAPQVPDARPHAALLVAASLATAVIVSTSLVLSGMAGLRAQIEDLRADAHAASAPAPLTVQPESVRAQVNDALRQFKVQQRAQDRAKHRAKVRAHERAQQRAEHRRARHHARRHR